MFLEQKVLEIINHYSKNPLEVPEGTHVKLAFQVSLQIDVFSEQLCSANYFIYSKHPFLHFCGSWEVLIWCGPTL